MDDAVARDGAAPVDRFFALEGSQSPARFADQDRGRTDIIGVHPRIDHGVGAAQENLPVAVEIGESTRRVACARQLNQGVSGPRLGELLETSVHHRRIGKGRHLGHLDRHAVVSRALALRRGKEIAGSGHVGDAGHGHAVRFDPDEDRPSGQAPNEGSRSVDRINDETHRGVVSKSAGLLAEETRVRIVSKHVLADRLLDFAIGHGDRAAVRLFFRDDTLLKVFHRSVARAHNDFLERAHRAKSTNTIDVEPLAHVRSMTCLTGCVKR